MRSLLDHVWPKCGIAPAAATTDNTAWVSNIIDRQGFSSLLWLIITGSLADADATFAVTMDHGDAANLSDAAAVPAADLDGQAASGTPTALTNASFDFSLDNGCRKIAYVGIKRYVRLTITPSANSGNAFVAAIALLGHPHVRATPNPPT